MEKKEIDRYHKRKDGTMEFILESWLLEFLTPEKQAEYEVCNDEDYKKYNLVKIYK